MNYDPRIEFGYADVGEIKLHYAKAGKGDRLVLLLHGFPEFWYSWRHQLVDLSDDLTVVAPDLRGYNLSDAPTQTSAYYLDKVTADAAALIRYFGKENAAVVGHDWGAAIAWSLASKHPELVWKLVAMQVPPPDVWKRNQSFKQLMASWYMFFFQLPGIPEWAASRNDFGLLTRSLRDSAAIPVFTDEVLAEYKSSWRARALTAMINYYRANIIHRLLSGGSTTTVTCPTLFIYGEKDHAILPETVKGIASVVKGSYEELRIPDSGHWVQQEARAEVSHALGKFLRQ